jgi:hypothetical protein
MRTILLAAAFALLAATLALPMPADAAGGCGNFRSDGAAVHAKVIRGRATCTTARRVLRRYLSSTAPCSGSACVRYDAGWVCATATTTAFPRLASCRRGATVIAAYSSAD